MGRWDLQGVRADPVHNKKIIGRNRFRWEEFEALPRVLRDILNFAPVPLGSGRAYDALLDGSSLDQVVRQEVALARRFIGQETLMIYGPDHPNAPQPRADSAA